MTKCHHPGISELMGTFQDEQNLYFVFEYLPNGALSNLIQKVQSAKIPEEIIVTYAA